MVFNVVYDFTQFSVINMKYFVTLMEFVYYTCIPLLPMVNFHEFGHLIFVKCKKCFSFLGLKIDQQILRSRRSTCGGGDLTV